MAKNSIAFFGNGESFKPFDRETIALLNSCDDSPRKLIRGKLVKVSAECKHNRHRLCSTSPCKCKCHNL